MCMPRCWHNDGGGDMLPSRCSRFPRHCQMSTYTDTWEEYRKVDCPLYDSFLSRRPIPSGQSATNRKVGQPSIFKILKEMINTISGHPTLRFVATCLQKWVPGQQKNRKVGSAHYDFQVASGTMNFPRQDQEMEGLRPAAAQGVPTIGVLVQPPPLRNRTSPWSTQSHSETLLTVN